MVSGFLQNPFAITEVNGAIARWRKSESGVDF